MLMNQVLDSSSVPHGSVERSRPLKRSASVASLPTPPRTQHKRSRSRARSSLSHRDSDGSGSASEHDGDVRSRDAGRIKRAKTSRHAKDVSDNDEHSGDESPDRKKRRTRGVLPGHDEEEDENVFWTDRRRSSCGEKQEKKADQVDKAEGSSPSPAMLRYRVRAPVSPPPSRRVALIHSTRAASVERDGVLISSVDPVTPPSRPFPHAPSPCTADGFLTPARPKGIKIWPKRDSPNNPFLVDLNEKTKSHSEWDSSEDEDVIGEARVQDGTPTPVYEEKPTITYVFRGQKATFHNPLYGLAPDVIAASKLPLDHPEYEAAEACPPKRLFASARKRGSKDLSREGTSTVGVKRTNVRQSENGHQGASEDDECGDGIEIHKTSPPAESAEGGAVLLRPTGGSPRQVEIEELQSAREERERRETAAKSRLSSTDGLRAGAVLAERDEPARRAMGPLRSA